MGGLDDAGRSDTQLKRCGLLSDRIFETLSRQARA